MARESVPRLSPADWSVADYRVQAASRSRAGPSDSRTGASPLRQHIHHSRVAAPSQTRGNTPREEITCLYSPSGAGYRISRPGHVTSARLWWRPVNQVMVVQRTPGVPSGRTSRLLQRCGDHPCVGRCDPGRSGRGGPGGKAGDAMAPGIVDAVLAGPGVPLADPLRRGAQQRFGYDFSQVRVHADAEAARSADAVRASA